jgi:SecD/SecF fusion protein
MKLLNNIKLTPLNTGKVVKRLWFVPLVILVLAITILSIFGFNQSLDFNTGRQFYVVFNDTLDEDTVKDYKSEIKSVLRDSEACDYKIEYLENNITSRISVTIKDKSFKNDAEMNDIMNEIRSDIADALDIDLTITENYKSHITEVVKYYPTYSTIHYLWGSLILLGLIAMIVLYTWIRFGMTYALTTFLGLVFEMFMTVSFVILCRIPVYITFAIPLAVILLLSSFIKFTIFDKMKEVIKLDADNKYSDAEYVDLAVDQLTYNLVVALISVLLLFVAFMFVGLVTSLWYIIPMILGTVLAILGTIYVTCASWSKIYNKNKDKRLLEKKKKTENDTIVV